VLLPPCAALAKRAARARARGDRRARFARARAAGRNLVARGLERRDELLAPRRAAVLERAGRLAGLEVNGPGSGRSRGASRSDAAAESRRRRGRELEKLSGGRDAARVSPTIRVGAAASLRPLFADDNASAAAASPRPRFADDPRRRRGVAATRRGRGD